MKRRNWTRDELILAYNGYCKIPYGRFNNQSEEVKELATLIGDRLNPQNGICLSATFGTRDK